MSETLLCIPAQLLVELQNRSFQIALVNFHLGQFPVGTQPMPQTKDKLTACHFIRCSSGTAFRLKILVCRFTEVAKCS